MVYSLPGSGKTSFLGTCPTKDIGVAACETGEGNGLLSIADRGVDYIVPENLSELQQFCEGKIFPDKRILAIDSLSAIAKTIIKDAALGIPRTGGESPKRKMGIPELDDYGVIGELTRKTLALLINANPTKHILVTALEKYDKPGPNDAPGTEALIGPDLSGQMFLGSAALFDFVFRLKTRSVLKDPKDAKSRVSQRYFQTQQENGVIAKCRSNAAGRPLLDKEEVFDLTTGEGGFKYLVDKIVNGYIEAQAPLVAAA